MRPTYHKLACGINVIFNIIVKKLYNVLFVGIFLFYSWYKNLYNILSDFVLHLLISIKNILCCFG